jgi:hypothetical protein
VIIDWQFWTEYDEKDRLDDPIRYNSTIRQPDSTWTDPIVQTGSGSFARIRSQIGSVKPESRWIAGSSQNSLDQRNSTEGYKYTVAILNHEEFLSKSQQHLLEN